MTSSRLALLAALVLLGACSKSSPPASPQPAAPEAAPWTAGRVLRKAGPAAAQATLTAVRSARHEGFDRVVFEFAEGAVPGYEIEYVDRPIIQCGSGDPTPVAGDGWLHVRLTPARAHTEQGRPTVAFRAQRVRLGVVRELVRTCDFEGEVTWVLGVAHPNRFRVAELGGPPRLVVDVRH